jgi:tRNA-dihydrouridine synthase
MPPAAHFLVAEQESGERSRPKGALRANAPPLGIPPPPPGTTVQYFRFLYEIFSESDIKISVKTRIGYEDKSEIEDLMNIYNKYQISQLIVHPRTRIEFYKGIADKDAFKYAYNVSKNKVCYNGDVCSKEDFEEIKNQFPDAEGVMIGRGALKNPAIFREINGGARLKTDELIEFSERLTKNYLEFLGSETFTLHKLKEVWYYMLLNFPEEKKISKAIKKANRLIEFTAAIECLPQI